MALKAEYYLSLSDISLTLTYTERFVLLVDTTSYASGHHYHSVVVECKARHGASKGLACTYVLRVFGIASVIMEGMSVLFHRDVVVADRYVDGELSLCVCLDGCTILRCQRTINIQLCSFDGDGGVLIIDATLYGERADVLEVNTIVGE